MDTLPTVYLCGPITGIKSNEALEWREYVTGRLKPDIITIDPTRDNPNLQRESKLPGTIDRRLSRSVHGTGVIARDRFDLRRSDLVLANFLGAERVSIGSVGEIFWADAMRIPVIIVREESGNIHDHEMLNALAGWILPDLDAAIGKVRLLLRYNDR